MMERKLIRLSSLMIILTSCVRSDIASIETPRLATASQAHSILNQHDFGLVLAQGQTLRHSFILRNPSTPPPSVNSGDSAYSLLFVDRSPSGIRTSGWAC